MPSTAKPCLNTKLKLKPDRDSAISSRLWRAITRTIICTHLELQHLDRTRSPDANPRQRERLCRPPAKLTAILGHNAPDQRPEAPLRIDAPLGTRGRVSGMAKKVVPLSAAPYDASEDDFRAAISCHDTAWEATLRVRYHVPGQRSFHWSRSPRLRALDLLATRSDLFVGLFTLAFDSG